MDKVRLLLVDDHPLFRRGVASVLVSQPDLEVVGEASDGLEALELCRELMPDLILMDIYMPRCDGLEATRLIKAEIPYVKIVMLTISEEDAKLFDAIKAGAQGYLVKLIDPEEFFQMIRGVARGEAPISRSVAGKILDEFARRVKQAEPDDSPLSALSKREVEVLEVVAVGQTNREIAASLGISENTVKNHLRNILDKLHLQNRVQAAAFALSKGLGRFPPGGREAKPGNLTVV